MKNRFLILSAVTLLVVATAIAQPRSGRNPMPAGNASRGYASDLEVVRDAQEQALQQAREMLGQTETATDRAALETAIKEMERAQVALDKARNSPAELPAAVSAQQAAYQALLRATPREFRVNQSRNRSRGQNSGSRQPGQRQLDQLEMTREENRYETARQATTPASAQQREQLQVADRLKELAQRQQDLNERVRELQSALQAARTEQEREEIQRQLKRLRDEQRQMLADVDELRQNLEQSPNASSLAEAREQLDQTRSDMQRAAEELDRDSPSQALAAGSRAQQGMQNLRDDLRQQTASEFAEQMREIRNQARELAREQEQIAQDLESLTSGPRQSLDDSPQRQQLAEQLTQQQSALTNLLSDMRDVIEQSESIEPLLSRQLYDTLRRADQSHTDNLLEMGSQLVDRGFLPQASEVERSARENINTLRQGVERAAESVLGSEADALRFAQRELDDLARQVEQELAAAGTNTTNQAAGGTGALSPGSSELARASAPGGTGNGGTNSIAGAGRGSGTNETPGIAASSERGQGGQRGQQGDQPPTPDASGEQASAQGQGNRGGAQGNGEQGEGNRGGGGQRDGDGQPALAQNSQDEPGNAGSQTGDPQEPGQRGGGGGGGVGDRLREWVQQLGNSGGDGGGGPITGDNFMDWSERMRDVERALDPDDLRNQLATVRERTADLRREYRDRGVSPSPDQVQQDILTPMTQVRVWLREELARQENVHSLVPLDRDPVPEAYSELVRKYYERLGSAQ